MLPELDTLAQEFGETSFSMRHVWNACVGWQNKERATLVALYVAKVRKSLGQLQRWNAECGIKVFVKIVVFPDPVFQELW